MADNISKINFDEAEYFYKSEHAIVDYSQMQSFSLIKSTVELFAYYGITDFSAADIKAFFERIQLVQKKYNKVFIPSAKKVSGVLDCCLKPSKYYLSFHNGTYHIEEWNTDGYKYELARAYDRGYVNVQ